MGKNNSASGEAASSSLRKPLLPNTEIADEEAGLGIGKKDQSKLRTVHPRFADIPDTEGLSWQDDFFDDHGHGRENVIAVFDKDVEKMKDFNVPSLYINCATLPCVQILYHIFRYDIPWEFALEAAAQSLAFVLPMDLILLFLIWRIAHKTAEFFEGQHIAVTTEGLMTVRFDPFVHFLPHFVFNRPLPEPKISKFRIDEIRSCKHKRMLMPLILREFSYVIINVKGRCLPLFGYHFEYADALVRLVNHLKEEADLVAETAEYKRLRESEESDDDLKAADWLRYYFRNKTLKIWRNVDINALVEASATEGGVIRLTGAGAPIFPGQVDHINVQSELGKQLKIDLEDHEKVQSHPEPTEGGVIRLTGAGAPIFLGQVDHINVRSELGKRLKIDLEDHEKVQIHPEPISHSDLDESSDAMEEALGKMKELKEGEVCDVQLKNLGEYLVKIYLRGGYTVGLRLVVLKR